MAAIATKFTCTRKAVLQKGKKRNLARDLAIYISREMIGKSGVALGRFQELPVWQHHPNSANPIPRCAVSVGPGPGGIGCHGAAERSAQLSWVGRIEIVVRIIFESYQLLPDLFCSLFFDPVKAPGHETAIKLAQGYGALSSHPPLFGAFIIVDLMNFVHALKRNQGTAQRYTTSNQTGPCPGNGYGNPRGSHLLEDNGKLGFISRKKQLFRLAPGYFDSSVKYAA
jgi:hypothetical protein